MVESKDIALEEDIQNLKKISRIYIQKSDNPDDGEDAIIAIPIKQVIGLTEALSWEVK